MARAKTKEGLTVEQILELEGVRLSAAVDEYVFGHPHRDVTDEDIKAGLPVFWFPWYSTDILATWRVVAKLAPLVGDWEGSDGWFHLCYGEFGDHSEDEDDCQPIGTVELDDDAEHDPIPWSCHLHIGAPGKDSDCPDHWKVGDTFCAHGKTASIAICRASLLSMVGAYE